MGARVQIPAAPPKIPDALRPGSLFIAASLVRAFGIFGKRSATGNREEAGCPPRPGRLTVRRDDSPTASGAGCAAAIPAGDPL